MIKENGREPDRGIPGQVDYLRALIVEASQAVKEGRDQSAITFLEHAREPIDKIIGMLKTD